MDITKLSEVELKAMILDELEKVENAQRNIQVLQAQRAKLKAEAKNEPEK